MRSRAQPPIRVLEQANPVSSPARSRYLFFLMSQTILSETRKATTQPAMLLSTSIAIPLHVSVLASGYAAQTGQY